MSSMVSLVNINHVCYHYLGSDFPWRKNGFSSLIDMLRAMPEAVRFDPAPYVPECRLYGIGSRDMFMPSWVIKAQGTLAD